MSRQHWVLSGGWCEILRTSVPASLSEITARQVNDWITEQARRGLNSQDYQYPARICHVVAMFRYFRDMGVEMPELKIRHIVRQKRPSRFAAFSTRESKIEQVLGYCNQIQWLLVKNCRLTVACESLSCGTQELMNISTTGWLYLLARVANGGKCIWVELAKDWHQWIVSQRIICGRSQAAHCSATPRYLCVSRSIWLDFCFPCRTLQTFSETGRRMESQEMLDHSSAVITPAIFVWMDGQMAACFWKIEV